MASPAEPVHPPTPPPEATQPTNSATHTQSQSQQLTATQDPAARVEALLSEPLTSLHDDGTSKRPRDHRLIHLLLAQYGISAYQERVPLQLMDFAYRYTSAVLSDAKHIQDEGYDQANAEAAAAAGKGRGRANKTNDDGDISMASLRMSVSSRLGYQFSSSLPKEFLKQLADEKNRTTLATSVNNTENAGPSIGGVRLPHERHCLTGRGWGLKDEWESEGEESVEENGVTQTSATDGMQIDEEEGMEEDEEGVGRMEDVFGEEGGGDGDTEMQT
ncbi:Transcription initiation factor TFIID subunit 9 [Lithohypha guttulata]|uniref:Transcription initiation factor TFIID subunit 9 n=1 Tax=Lithohypha guttulata TaxID=1690604 RepID=A0AAN7SZF4_9EURO|nr:Transcription initiation factor TFIID subunit 9 [Lithohypha guttulata]KAK5085672.1 Transcription initiation factor TFIID subunit 9 [Lithohypha guttulata]KAK5103444.1 Transcription initiation factor TFIID subunit 9 [Lithohypha guttulata]